MPFRIETDQHWRDVLGIDGPASANAYMWTQQHREGDMRLIELAAWFDAAIDTVQRKQVGRNDT